MRTPERRCASPGHRLTAWTDRAVTLAAEATAARRHRAVGTAALLQVTAITDLVGPRVAAVITDNGHRDQAARGYGASALLGVLPTLVSWVLEAGPLISAAHRGLIWL